MVTGAGAVRGMGRAIARGLARAGAAVACADIDPDLAADCASQIQREGGRAGAIAMDVTSASAVDQGVAETVRQFGTIDILVNNAGIAHFSLLLDLEERDWDRVMNVNLKGAFLCAQASARQMVRQGGGGCIVNVGSISAEAAGAMKGHYCASKAGVRMLTAALALELAMHGIRVNEIAPGDIDTDIIKQEHIRRQAAAIDLAALVPLGRRGHVDDVVGAVLFLVSDSSAYVTGATIKVDGGLTAGTSFPRDARSK